MSGVLEKKYSPDPHNVRIYNRLYDMYRKLHDLFGTREYKENLYGIMKDLLAMRDEVRG
jgi:L-ribulokinase